MRFSIDVETACTVPGCPDHGKSLCRSKHALSPWHSRITVLAAVGENGDTAVIRSGPATLKKWLEERDPDYTVDGHGFKFDWLHLARHGFEIPLDRWVGDSQLAAYVMTEKIPDSWLAVYEERRLSLKGGHHRKASKHSLKTLAPFFLNVEPFWEPEGEHDDDQYVLKDADYTRKLMSLLEAKLIERSEYWFYKQRLLPWTKMLLEAEWRGLKVDETLLGEKESELQERAVALKAQLDEQWADAHEEYVARLKGDVYERYSEMTRAALGRMKEPTDEKVERTLARYERLAQGAVERVPACLEYDSPKQMAWLLRDFKGYDIESLEGDEGTGREVLERLAEEGHEDVRTYLEWRRCNKILTAFLPTYRDLMIDGTLHPIFNPDSTRTGRTSSERPNCQQVPPALRNLFVARPGFKFIGYDAAAIEAKLIALYSGDPTLFRLIEQGVSIHDQNVRDFFELDTPHAEVKSRHPQERRAAKNVGFALFYNAGWNRIRIALAQLGFHKTREECKRILDRFKRRFAVAMEYTKGVVEYMEQGNVLENLLGRPLRIEHPEDAYMQAFNTLIQSSASDLNLHGAYKAHCEFKAAGIEAYPVLFVHDFVAFEVKDEHVAEADAILQRCLTDFSLETRLGPIKLEVDGGVSERWEK